MPIKVEVPNLRKLVGNAFDEALVKITTEIEALAKKTSPVDTGYFRNRIKREGKDKVVANAEYSAAVEYGFAPGYKTKTFTYKKGRKPNPVMRNAARNVQQKVPNILAEIINRK